MKTVPLPLPEPQAKAVAEAARRSGLSQADVLLQSVVIGLPMFLERTCPGQPPDDYALLEYDVTDKQLKRALKKGEREIARERKAGKLKPYTGNLRADLED